MKKAYITSRAVLLTSMLMFLPANGLSQPSSEHRPPKEAVVNIQELKSSYQDLEAEEGKAAKLTSALDSQTRLLELNASKQALTTTMIPTRIPMVPERLGVLKEQLKIKEKLLLDIDKGINARFHALYKKATMQGLQQSNELLVRTALLHWTVLLRRMSMQSFHTEVDGVIDDPDCAGDIIRDQFFLRYFDSLFEIRPKKESAVLKTLTVLANQSSCLGTQQSVLLASNLYVSYTKLRSYLKLNGLESLVPYVAQAGAQPLLLFYDVEKYRGSQSPLYQWFAENREALEQGVKTGRHPALWHGLWLYDRRAGRLLGYKHVWEPRDENEIDLARFYDSIVNHENLGKSDCTFMEMVERGPNKFGYFCAGSMCYKPSSGILIKPASARNMFLDSARRLRGTTDEVQARICGADREGNGSGAGTCGNGLDVAGSSRASGLVRCLSEQIVESSPSAAGREVLQCIVESTGRCSNPEEALAKQVQQLDMAGIKTGKQCQLSISINELLNPKNPDPAVQKVGKAYLEYDNAKTEYKQAREKERDASVKLGEANKEYNDYNRDQSPLERVVEAVIGPSDAEKNLEQARNQAATEFDAAKSGSKQAEEKLNEAKEKLKQAEEDTGISVPIPGTGHVAYCPPEALDCGTNDCTAMEDATSRMNACVRKAMATGQEMPDPYNPLNRQPGECNPTICNPINPSSPSDAAFGQCFDQFFNDGRSQVSKQCMFTDCGADKVAVLSQGSCQCSSQGGGKILIDRFCWEVDCGDPMARNGEPHTEDGGRVTEDGRREPRNHRVPKMKNGRCDCGLENPSNPGDIGPLPPPPPYFEINVSSGTER